MTPLAIEPDGNWLYAGTRDRGVFDYELSTHPQEPCTPALDSLCLLGGRFRVSVTAADVRGARTRTTSGVAIAQDDRFGYFSLPELTGDATFPEVFVKMVDASSLPNGVFWVFHQVTDTSTGDWRV